MEATFEGGQGPEGAVGPWMDGYTLVEIGISTWVYRSKIINKSVEIPKNFPANCAC
jgi:hypothetical protein